MSQGISRPMKWNTSNSITEPINTKTIDDSCAYKQYLHQTSGPVCIVYMTEQLRKVVL